MLIKKEKEKYLTNKTEIFEINIEVKINIDIIFDNHHIYKK